MTIKRVQCVACKKYFDEDKINMIGNKYLCNVCFQKLFSKVGKHLKFLDKKKFRISEDDEK